MLEYFILPTGIQFDVSNLFLTFRAFICPIFLDAVLHDFSNTFTIKIARLVWLSLHSCHLLLPSPSLLAYVRSFRRCLISLYSLH